jgi:GH25 family lysozyme M1 (1,4-beta-N-acetylmuramidase)
MALLHNTPAAPTCESASTSSLFASRFFRRVVAALAFICASFALTMVGSSVTASPASALLRGIDVSSWQHSGTSGSTCGRPIDWVQVRNSGISFAYVKSTEATTYTNPCFAQDWAGIAGVGLLRGSYHYAKPALPLSTAVDQARYFVSRAGSMTGPGDLPGMLDLEETGGLNATQLSDWTRTFMNEVTLLTGKKPVLYMGAYFFPGTIAPDISANYRLWLPSYLCQSNTGERLCNPYTDTRQPRLPTGWSSWTWWQFSSIEKVPGIYANSFNSRQTDAFNYSLDNVDMNFFCCDLASLQALAGSGSGAGSPFGILHSISVPEPTYANVFGWAIDPDSRDPIPVDVYVYGPDGQPGVGRRLEASGEFPGLTTAYPGFGGAHAYFTALPVPLGAKQVCAFGINVGSGGNSLLGCKSLGGDPYGVIDSARAVGPGRIEVSGWAIDPNGITPTQVVARINGADTVVTANQDRPDLGNPGGLGNLHGYTATIQVPTGGNVQVCMGAANSIGPGSSVSLGCRTVALPGGSPLGVIDTAISGIGSLSVTGWVVDPDTAAAIDVHVYVNGIGRLAIRADGTRNDVAAGFPGYGPSRGYSGSVSVGGGAHTVCVYGINVGVGNHSLLGCRAVQVAGGSPFGALDTVTFENGSLRVTGWAVDPDTVFSIPVHVYVQGQGYALTANGNRPDIAGGLPAYGAAHGFDNLLPAPEGRQTVCAYAINVGLGNHSLLGCRTVVVPMGSPIGHIDGASITNGTVSLNGWAIDPNTAGPDIVHIYVNGVGFEVIANQNRPDLGNPWGLGSAHGWSFATPRIGTGVQRVCVYALNIAGPGSHQLLGCRDLS